MKTLMALALALAAGELLAVNTDFLFTTNGTTVTITRNPDVTVTTDSILTQPFPDATVVRKVVMSFGNLVPVIYRPTQLPALPDGLEVRSGQLRVDTQLQLGEGPVTLGTSSTIGQLVFLQAGRYEIANRVTFANKISVVISTQTTCCPVVTQVATANGVTMPLLGRASGDCALGLALAEDSAAVAGYSLQGALQPFSLGGCLRLTAGGAMSRVFDHVGNEADLAKAQFRMTEAPLTLDVAADADRFLDLPFEFFGPREIAVAPANGSFESGEADWTLAKLQGSDGKWAGEKVGVKQNGEATWVPSTSRTPYGSKFYVMRCLHKLTSAGTVALEAGSDWHVGFAAATRSNYASYKIVVTVRLIGGGKTYTATLPARSNYHNFLDFQVGPFDIPSGDYTVELATSCPAEDKDKWSALSVDNIRVMRSGEYVTPVVKRGGGAITLSGQKIKGSEVSVEEGVLRLADNELDGTDVRVRDGGTLALSFGSSLGAGGLAVQVAEGGCLALEDSVNRVANPSFELGVAAGEGFVNRIPAGWLGERVFSCDGNANGSGFQRNGGTVTPPVENGPYTPAGEITAYLRIGYRYSQTLTVPETGTYRFSFLKARRRKHDVAYDWKTFHLKVLVNDQVVEGAEDVPLTTDYERFETDLALTAGKVTLAFETYGENVENGPMCFIDDVRICRPIPSGEVDEKVALDLAPGSILQLDNAAPIVLKRPLTVNGVPVNGGKSAIRRAGVIVRGGGKITTGDPEGVLIIVR